MADYAYDRACLLEAKGYKPEQEWKSRNMVSVSENGKTYKVEVGRHLDSAVFPIDGVIIKIGQKCDKFLSVVAENHLESVGTAVFIELKGVDISHAVDQLEETIKNNIFKPYPTPNDKVRARIITGGCGPKSSSRIKIEQARIRFKQQYNVELKVLKNFQTDNPIK